MTETFRLAQLLDLARRNEEAEALAAGFGRPPR